MVGRVVEVATDGRHLAIDRGFMTVGEKGAELGRVPLDDLAAVVANAHGLTYSNNLLVNLATRGVPLRYCAGKEQAEAYERKIEQFMPASGKVHILAITDKQYENIRTYRGRKRERSAENPNQFALF